MAVMTSIVDRAAEMQRTASTRERVSAAVLGAFRIVVSFLFACHGARTLFGVLGGTDGQGGSVAFGAWPGWWAAAIQLVAGGLVLVGLFTRAAALLCSGSMAYAYFVVHAPEALLPISNGGEPSAIFSWSFLLVAVLGPGSLALDSLRRRSA